MVLIGFFENVFYSDFNSTMPSQIAGKSLPPTQPPYHPPIIHNPAISRKLSTAMIADRTYNVQSLGVFLSRERVAFTERHWKENEDMSVFVYCWDQNLKMLYQNNYKLQYRIPEFERFYLAEDIVEVKVSSIYNKLPKGHGDMIFFRHPTDDSISGLLWYENCELFKVV